MQNSDFKVYFAADHAGFELKSALVLFVRELGYVCEDLGAHEFVEEDDYPDYIALAAAKVSADPLNTRAIVLGGSGQGEAIVANKFPYVRATVFYGEPMNMVTFSREHNDANVLSLGARFIMEDEAKEVVRIWLETQFSEDERHVRRLKKIAAIEAKHFK